MGCEEKETKRGGELIQGKRRGGVNNFGWLSLSIRGGVMFEDFPME